MSAIELKKLLGACYDLGTRAGIVIQTLFEKGDLQVIDKALDGKILKKQEILNSSDPSTIADVTAQKIIVSSLEHLFPGITICGEEDIQITEDDIIELKTEIDVNIPDELQTVLIKDIIVWVDPIDGTKEFTEGIKEAVTCLIGIAYRGRPIAGVINRPFFDQTIYGVVGDTVYGLNNIQSPRDSTRRIIATTRSHFKPNMMEYISACHPSGFVRAGGCGGKVLMILEGLADAYVFPTRGSKKWDTCAPEAILLAAGGKLTEPDGSLLDYSSIVNKHNENGFIATLFGDEYHESYLRPNLIFKKYDVILFGASGFTGEFGVEFLGRYYGDSDLRFGLAARNIDKLRRVVEGNIIDETIAAKFDLIQCDSNDKQQVEELVQSTHVIVTTVGPYQKYGTTLLEACAQHGVDYVDITGELHWVKKMDACFGELARQTGARIVTVCGFVSAPVDCGIYSLTEFLEQECNWNASHGLNIEDFTLIEGDSGMSGGTADSWITSLVNGSGQEILKDMAYICPSGKEACITQLPSIWKRWSTYHKCYTIQSLYSETSARIVNRSNCLLNNKYGSFNTVRFESVLKAQNMFIAYLSSFTAILVPLISLLLKFKFIENFVRSLYPSPGTHQISRDKLKKSIVRSFITGSDQSGNAIARVELCNYSDPYANSAHYLIEGGIIFALQRMGKLTNSLPLDRGGFLTPGAAFGSTILRRLSSYPFFTLKWIKL